jgi:hypothetical protein
MPDQTQSETWKVEIPLDASGVENSKPDHPVKVLVADGTGRKQETLVSLNEKGEGTATFIFPENPGALHIVVGPHDASAEELLGLQTITLDVSAAQWQGRKELKLPPIAISSYYWNWWLIWCRTFTIRGRVLCPDGRPVPGAQVCAYDVDWWWWWTSWYLIGCATTDVNGVFEIRFRWCCGWWPWWWWLRRVWQLEPALVERILPVLQRDPRLPKLPSPSPKPSTAIFEQLLSDHGHPTVSSRDTVDPATLAGLRDRLLKRLPKAPELEKFEVWPWWPWFPWLDCAPDVLFRVTQDCPTTGNVIVDEGLFQVRYDIPTTLDVTLVANEKACCVPPTRGCREGNCLDITDTCSGQDLVNNIGGNVGAAPAPVGYVNPGAVSISGDRPYAGVVTISGTVECMTGIDYYEFEWSDDNGATWNDMPPPADGDFTRVWVDTTTTPFSFGSHNFSAQVPVAGRHVYESLQHFEANHPPPNWGTGRIWLVNRDVLMNWLTENNFSDGTDYLRVKGWNLAGSNLVNPRILPTCDSQNPTIMKLTIDNRAIVPPAAHPHPCGPGTVHICTTEPDTNINAVTIIHADGRPPTAVGACGNVPINDTDILQIDFLANDPDGHLALYTLDATYGDNLLRPLIHTGYPGGDVLDTEPSASLTGSPGVPVGPNYGYLPNPARSALSQGAVSPHWNGGTYRFSVLAKKAFPETCCYQLELRAYKRTIVDCYHGLDGHMNLSEYSFMVVV